MMKLLTEDDEVGPFLVFLFSSRKPPRLKPSNISLPCLFFFLAHAPLFACGSWMTSRSSPKWQDFMSWTNKFAGYTFIHLPCSL